MQLSENLIYETVLTDKEQGISYKDFSNRVRSTATRIAKQTKGPLSVTVILGRVVLSGKKGDEVIIHKQGEIPEVKSTRSLGAIGSGPDGRFGYYLNCKQLMKPGDLLVNEGMTKPIDSELIDTRIPRPLVGFIFRPV